MKDTDTKPDDDVQESARWRPSRRELLVLAVFILFPAILFFGMKRAAGNVAGFYLVGGGQGYLVIEPRMTGYEVVHFSFPWGSHLTDWKVRTRRGLRLETASSMSGSSGGTTVMRFRPSEVRKGDFDLTLVEEIPGSSTWYGRMWDIVKRWWNPPGSVTLPPLLSYLHRVDDASVASYMQLVSKEPKPSMPGWATAASISSGMFAPTPQAAQLLSLSRGAHLRAPDDLYVRVLLLDALARAHEIDELGQLLLKWRSDFAAAPREDTLAIVMFRQLVRKHRGLAAGRSGKNGFVDLLSAVAADTTLTQSLSIVSGMAKHEALSRPGGVTCTSDAVMNFLTAQVSSKIYGVYVWFRVLDGDLQGATDLALGRLRFGQLIAQQDTYLITKLISIAIRSIAATDLQRLAANAPYTVEQLDALGNQLARLSQDELPGDQVNFRDFEFDVEFPTSGGSVNVAEVGVRHNSAAARVQLARVIAANRRALLATGTFADPANAESLKPILPGELPIDPFTPTTSPEKLRLATTSQTLIAYSIGPDAADDSAGWEYDPTNGTVSTGDITAELRQTSKYPFPTEGVFAESTATILSQFPEGLPPDPFADSRGRGLSVLQTTGSVVVFSYGPDTNQREVEDAKGAYVPTIQYDPTNGTVSRGDLITTLAKTREELLARQKR